MASYQYQITNTTEDNQNFTLGNQTFYVNALTQVHLTTQTPITSLPPAFNVLLLNSDGTTTVIQTADPALQPTLLATQATQQLIYNLLYNLGQPNNPLNIILQQSVIVSQTKADIPLFDPTNIAGANGGNQTIVQLLAPNPQRKYCEFINRGAYDAELWFGGIPLAGQIGYGKLAPANGGGVFYDNRLSQAAVYCTASGPTRFCILEGV